MSLILNDLYQFFMFCENSSLVSEIALGVHYSIYVLLLGYQRFVLLVLNGRFEVFVYHVYV